MTFRWGGGEVILRAIHTDDINIDIRVCSELWKSDRWLHCIPKALNSEENFQEINILQTCTGTR